MSTKSQRVGGGNGKSAEVMSKSKHGHQAKMYKKSSSRKMFSPKAGFISRVRDTRGVEIEEKFAKKQAWPSSKKVRLEKCFLQKLGSSLACAIRAAWRSRRNLQIYPTFFSSLQNYPTKNKTTPG